MVSELFDEKLTFRSLGDPAEQGKETKDLLLSISQKLDDLRAGHFAVDHKHARLHKSKSKVISSSGCQEPGTRHDVRSLENAQFEELLKRSRSFPEEIECSHGSELAQHEDRQIKLPARGEQDDQAPNEAIAETNVRPNFPCEVPSDTQSRLSRGSFTPKVPSPTSSLRNMETLRANVDADRLMNKLKSIQPIAEGDAPEHTDEPFPGSLNTAARYVLCCSGVINLSGDSWLSCILACCVLGMLSSIVIYSITDAVQTSAFVSQQYATTVYGLGAILGIISMRASSINELLCQTGGALDEYAWRSGFLADWRRLSTRRFLKISVFWAVMVTCRVLVAIISNSLSYGGSSGVLAWDLVRVLVHIIVSIPFTAVAFVQLHVCCGLELAVDSFCQALFLELDIDTAIQEWSVLQALLRKVASHIDGSFLALGTAALAALALTALEVTQEPSLIRRGRDAALWFGWNYPPILLSLYTILKAASVTAKCCRVAPLVNSWDFQAEDPLVPKTRHAGRQYLIQYMIQSRAGFYVKGIRLTAFVALKLGYFVGTVTFCMITQSLLAS